MSSTRPYRPSNGTEGAAFERRFCGTCAKWDATETPEGYDVGCDIQFGASIYNDGDAEYPSEWVECDALGPRCTAYAQRTGYEADGRPAPRCPNTLDMFAEGT